MKIKSRLQKVLKIALQVSVLVLGSIMLTVFLKVFCFASFKVPSGSMEPVLQSGDQILVNKLILGPRIFKDWNFFTNKNWEMRRLKGIRSLKRNEIVVFNFPISNNNWNRIEMDFNLHLVKRCVGVPGDTIEIRNGFYRVRGCSDTLGNYHNQLELSLRANITINKGAFNCLHYDSAHQWNIKNFGPLYIPQAHAKIRIHSGNIELYRKIIVYESGKSVEVKRNVVLLGGKPITEYTFHQNYYFMSGDNIQNSMDSRYWGLLPEDHIIGKVAFIWKSKDESTGKYRWERFFKGL